MEEELPEFVNAQNELSDAIYQSELLNGFSRYSQQNNIIQPK